MKGLRIRNKRFLLGLLMIISIAVLTGFSLYWLRSQYLEEKKLLTEELSAEFMEANEAVRDSILFTFYIKPVISDSVFLRVSSDQPVKGKTTVFVKSSEEKRIIRADSITRVLSWDSLPGKQLMTFRHHISDSLTNDPELKLRTNDMLIRSFELIMSHSGEGPEKDSMNMFIVRDPEMIRMLEQNFTARLSALNPQFRPIWEKDSAGTVSGDLILLNDGETPVSTTVLVSGTRLYLFRQIIPQLIFILFLVGFTSTAFLLSYRTIKKQYLLNRLRQDLISNMTHELKTPVATLKVALEAMDHYGAGKDTEKASEYMKIAGSEIDRLDRLISRMLDQVLLEEASASIRLVPVDLSGLLDECATIMEPRLSAAGATLKMELPDVPCTVRAEPLYLESAILNILDNSLKYAGDQPVIKIRLEHNGQAVHLHIDDNGPGIPPDYADRVFDKFFRVPAGDVHNIKGHGLGLSLVAAVMRLFGGRVGQQNLKDGGCRITLEFLPDPHED